LILVDTGPFVALFNPRDSQHSRCRELLETVAEPLVTTVPVLTEAFHLLTPGSRGAGALREFVLSGGVSVWFMDSPTIERAFEVMEQYLDHPADLADASLITAAESLESQKIFTIDRSDFLTYRIRLGSKLARFNILGET
jgi:predicted nucleic acid-binding protein